MPYQDFTLETLESDLGIRQRYAPLFPGVADVAPPPWLREVLSFGIRAAPATEKGRSEFVIAPILLAARQLSGERLGIFSGYRLDVDPVRRLNGECDFLLYLGDPMPRLRPPLLAVLEAKQQDIEGGMGQCAAQMVAVRAFNERAGLPQPSVYGCVTTGDLWQFLKLDGDTLLIETRRRFISEVGAVLAALLASVGLTPG